MKMEYSKIPTLWNRSGDRPFKIIPGSFSSPELELLSSVIWEGTEKIDGTNIRIYWDGHKVKFDGRTDNAQIPAFLYERLNILFGGEANAQKLEEIFGGSEVVLYGEGFGNKIQSVGKLYNPSGVDFILFDVKVGDYWLRRSDIEDVASKLDIKVVPVIFRGDLIDLSTFVQDGFNSIYGNFQAEGVVAKPRIDLFNRRGERIIVKLKCKDF